MPRLKFENWFTLFTEKIRAGGYDGEVDLEDAFEDYAFGLSTDEASFGFLMELRQTNNDVL